MELEHFSHNHPLIYNEEQKNDGEKVACCGCKKLISSSPSYNCAKCKFSLHKKCAELPQEIKHPLHRRHPLTLFMAPQYDSGTALCVLCDKSLDNLVYNCSQCGFDLDINCALQPCVIGNPTGNYTHQFIRLLNSNNFTCDACGSEGTESPYLCIMCQVMVHKECISVSKTMKITEHRHVMTHFYFFQENKSVQPCGICHGQVQIEHGGYYCSDCDYIVHVNCAKKYEDRNHNPNSNFVADSFLESQIPSVEEEETTENKPYSHEHDLKIINEIGETKRCDGCMLPILAPIYACLKCNMFLHKKCCELFTKIKHPLHQLHSLTLLLKAPSVDGLFKCDACDQYCHGFCYYCNKCDFYLDLRCSAIMINTLEHQGHAHTLHLVHRQRNYGCYCSGCYCGKFIYFDCWDCNFSLDFKCATLPNSARHRFDENHPLTLNCDGKKSIEDYCIICEMTINPDSHIYDCVPWFYGCKECDISTHPDCVFGKYPYIKFGGAYSFDFHPHPLTLVQKPFILVERKKHYPPCDHCAQPFFDDENFGDTYCYEDLALQCIQCNFFIHRKGPCFTQHVKTGKTYNC